MNKIIFYKLAIVFFVAFFGCKKESEPGPQGPAGPDGKMLEGVVHKNGFIKLGVYTKAADGITDSLILTKEYLHEPDRTDSHYSEGKLPGFEITRKNTENLTLISINSELPPNVPIEEQKINMYLELKDPLGNGKMLDFKNVYVMVNESLEISNYSFDKATGKIRFKFNGYYKKWYEDGINLTIKGEVEANLNEEVYLRKSNFSN